MSGILSGRIARLHLLRAAKTRGLAAGGAQAWPKLLLIILAALCIWLAVRLVYAVAVPVGPLGEWQPKGAEIAPLAERRAMLASFDPFFRSAGRGPEAATVTSLGLSLFGINLNEATGGGSAIIAGEDGVQTSYAVGDEIAAGVTLAGLDFDHVILERGGVRESLFMDQSGAAEPVDGETGGAGMIRAPVAVAATAAAPVAGVAGVAANGEMSAEGLKKGIGFAPRLEGGKVTGITVQPTGDGAIFRAAGLKSGDVVRAINGRPIGSAADVAGMADAFRPGARLSLEVERGAGRVPVALFLAKS